MYRYTHSGQIERIEDGAIIPEDAANKDYLAFLQWMDQGNTPEPAVNLSDVDTTFGDDQWAF